MSWWSRSPVTRLATTTTRAAFGCQRHGVLADRDRLGTGLHDDEHDVDLAGLGLAQGVHPGLQVADDHAAFVL
jgi:hypothetical protein